MFPAKQCSGRNSDCCQDLRQLGFVAWLAGWHPSIHPSIDSCSLHASRAGELPCLEARSCACVSRTTIRELAILCQSEHALSARRGGVVHILLHPAQPFWRAFSLSTAPHKTFVPSHLGACCRDCKICFLRGLEPPWQFQLRLRRIPSNSALLNRVCCLSIMPVPWLTRGSSLCCTPCGTLSVVVPLKFLPRCRSVLLPASTCPFP